MVPWAPACWERITSKRYKKWTDWITDAKAKMKFINLTTDHKKTGFIRSCAGPELNELWEKEVRIRWEEVRPDEA